MTAAELAEAIRIGLHGHALIGDVRRVPTGIADGAALHVADRDALLWRIAVEPLAS